MYLVSEPFHACLKCLPDDQRHSHNRKNQQVKIVITYHIHGCSHLSFYRYTGRSIVVMDGWLQLASVHHRDERYA